MTGFYLPPLSRFAAPRRFLFVHAETRREPISPLENRIALAAAGCLYEERPGPGRKDYHERWVAGSAGAFAGGFRRVARYGGALTVILSRGAETANVVGLEAALSGAGYSIRSAFQRGEAFSLYGDSPAGSVRSFALANWGFGSVAELADAFGEGAGLLAGCGEGSSSGGIAAGSVVEELADGFRAHLAHLHREGLGPFRPTIAAQSLAAFRYRFMPPNLLIDRNPEHVGLARAAFRGGWVEAFRIGNLSGPEWYHLDINGSYLAAMAECALPLQAREHWEGDGARRLIGRFGPHACVAEVGLGGCEALCPPHMRPDPGDPGGLVRVALAGPELAFALERGMVRVVYVATGYQVHDFLRLWAAFTWDRRVAARAQGNAALARWWKLLGVSLYGKFAQMNDDWEADDGDWCPTGAGYRVYDSDVRELRVFRNGPAGQERLAGRREYRHAAPAVSGFIAAFGRMRLRELIEQAGRENVAYVDTDSLIVNRRGFDRLSGQLSGGRLGALKLEGVSRHLIVHGKKTYEFGDEVKSAGLSWDGTYSDAGHRMGVRRSVGADGAMRERRHEHVLSGGA